MRSSVVGAVNGLTCGLQLADIPPPQLTTPSIHHVACKPLLIFHMAKSRRLANGHDDPDKDI